MIQSSTFQTYITNKIIAGFSDRLNAKISLSKVNIRFFNRVILKDVYVEDQNKDTLFYFTNLKANIRSINLSERKIVLSRLTGENARIYFLIDSTGTINIKFFVDAIKSRDTTKVPWEIYSENLQLINSKFLIRKYNPENREYGINYHDMVFTELFVDVNNFKIVKGKLDFGIKNLSFKEKSGFYVQNLSSLVTITTNKLLFNNLIAKTAYSELKANSVMLKFKDYQEFRDYTNNINMDLEIKSSKININDLAYFAPRLRGIDKDIYILGSFKGKVNNLKSKKITIKYGEKSILKGSFTLNGLPDISNTFFFIEIDEFITNKNDIELIPSYPFVENKSIKVPDNIKLFGDLIYNGKITGFINDFVSYGHLTTDLGNIFTDVSLKNDSLINKTSFKGEIKTYNFNLGKFIGNEKIVGILGFNTIIDGNYIKGVGTTAMLEGIVNHVVFNNYDLKNVKIDGELTDKNFDGYVNVNDQNIKLDFLGRFDFSDTIPDYNFTLNVADAKLFPLNIDKKDTSSTLSFSLKTNIKGSKLDNIEGELNLFDTKLLKRNEIINIADLSLEVKKIKDNKELILRSDLLDIEVTGKYYFSKIVNSFKDFIFFYIPSISKINSSNNLYSQHDFSFTIELKNTETLSKIFFPDIIFSRQTTINGEYNSDLRKLDFKSEISKLLFYGTEFNELNINVFAKDSTLSVNAGSNTFNYLKDYNVKNFLFSAQAKKDSIFLNINWNNWDTVNYSGNLSSIIHFSKQSNKKNIPLIEIELLPSNIVISDTLWSTNKSKLIIDSTSYKIDDFSINNNYQQLSLNGKISYDINDTLSILFNELSLSKANIITKEKRLELDGVINGEAKISDFYNNTLFHSNININNFKINNEKIGNVVLSSNWDKENKKIQLQAYAKRGKLNTLDIYGNYFPHDKTLDFNINFNKFKINVIESFLSNLISNLKGTATGNVQLTGTIKKPEFNGKIDVQRVSFIVDYLKTQYSLSHIVDITKDGIYFNDVSVFDSKGDIAKANGALKYDYLKNLEIDITLNSDNFHYLNTFEKDNTYFYGNAVATGITKIKGKPKDIVIDISAKTEKGTKFYIPLSSGEDINKMDFITFLDIDSENKIPEDDYEIDFSGLQLNFDLEVTPDAEVQLIFDSKVGDIIKGQGYADLNLEINSNGDFNMFGVYYIEEGDYLFTLKNVINKKFKIEKGSKISWNGDPYNANIDIIAFYNIRKTSIYDLTLDENHKELRLPVNCYLLMTDKLMHPTLKFDINIETTDENLKDIVKNMSDDEKNKQLLSLLVLNRFYTMDLVESVDQQPNEISMASKGMGTNASELLSNQLSHWLSQISNDFDIGVNIRPGDEITPEIYELALSTQILNNRVTLNGNVGYGSQQTATTNVENANNIVGDFMVDVKINKSGKLRVKAYTKANNELIYDSPSTQGVGIFYREEFDKFKDILKKYLNKLKKKN